MPVSLPHHSRFYRPDALPAAQPISVKALKAAIVHGLTGIKMFSVDDEKTTTNETQQNAALAQKSY